MTGRYRRTLKDLLPEEGYYKSISGFPDIIDYFNKKYWNNNSKLSNIRQ